MAQQKIIVQPWLQWLQYFAQHAKVPTMKGHVKQAWNKKYSSLSK